MDTTKYTKQTLLDAKLSVEFFPAEQVTAIVTDLSTAVDSKVAESFNNVHTHDNKAVLDGITAVKVAAWDRAETNATEYTDRSIGYALESLSNVYDAKGAAATAETNAMRYADGLARNYDAAGAASGALADAKTYTDTKVGELTAVYDVKGAAADALTAANSYTDTTVTNLINGAPEAYDTLKEIADWIANDESGVSALTNRVAALETGKADLSVVTKQGSDIAQMSTTVGNHVGNDDIHVTAANKETWNGKQDALTDAQLSAVNSGVTADWKNALDNWQTGTQGAINGLTTGLQTKAAQTDVDAVKADVLDIKTTLDNASQVQLLATNGSISTRDIVAKINELIGALAVQHVETPGS